MAGCIAAGNQGKRLNSYPEPDVFAADDRAKRIFADGHAVYTDLPEGVMAELVSGDGESLDSSGYDGGGGCFNGCLSSIFALIAIAVVLTALVYAVAA